MKKQFLFTMILLVSVYAVSFAADKKKADGPVTKLVMLTRSFHKLVVNGNVDVILFEDDAESISIVGNAKSSGAVRITQLNGVLTIESNRSVGRRVQVVVPVKHLREIEAGGSSRISAVTTLESPVLTLTINDACKIGVKTTGTINVEQGKDAEECYWAAYKKSK